MFGNKLEFMLKDVTPEHLGKYNRIEQTGQALMKLHLKGISCSVLVFL